VIDYSNGEFDVIREQEFHIIKSKNFIFKNNTLNEDMLNAKYSANNQKWIIFLFNFFNLLTRWFDDKFENLSSLFKVYRICTRVYKKKVLNNQLIENKGTLKLLRINEFDNHELYHVNF